MTPAPHLQLGYVAKAHGLEGEVLIRTFDPASEALLEVERVHVRRRDGSESELSIEGVRQAGNDLLVTFSEIDSREKAKALVGSTVFVFREDLEAPAEGEYFQGDLLGLEAFDPEGKPVGKLEEIWNTGEVPTLVIRSGAEEVLLPFADDFVDTVDLAQRRIVVKPPKFEE